MQEKVDVGLPLCTYGGRPASSMRLDWGTARTRPQLAPRPGRCNAHKFIQMCHKLCTFMERGSDRALRAATAEKVAQDGAEPAPPCSAVAATAIVSTATKRDHPATTHTTYVLECCCCCDDGGAGCAIGGGRWPLVAPTGGRAVCSRSRRARSSSSACSRRCNSLRSPAVRATARECGLALDRVICLAHRAYRHLQVSLILGSRDAAGQRRRDTDAPPRKSSQRVRAS